jgi:putative SOS response-associated peptidase YedK
VPVSGYYEWVGAGFHKEPYYIHATENPVLMLAGLFEPGAGEREGSFSILTTASAGSVQNLHDRMPLCLPAHALSRWLTCNAEEAIQLARALPLAELAFHRVPRAVGNVRNQGSVLIAPVDDLFGS